MPSRSTGNDDAQDQRRTQFNQRHQKGAPSTGSKTAQGNQRRKFQDTEDDAWDEIMSADTSNDFNNDGPSKFSLNYWLKPGDQDVISFVDENPVVFQGHTLKCWSTKSNKAYYRTEACAVPHGEPCAFCERAETNSNVSKPKRIIMFRIISGRGEWSTQDNDYDGIPSLKFFQTATVLAQAVGTFKKDENLDGLTSAAFLLTKNENYTLQPKMVKKGGALYFDDALELSEEEAENMPMVEEIYAPMEYDNANNFMDKCLSTQQESGGGRGYGQRRGGGAQGGGRTGNSRGGSGNGFYGSNRGGGGSGTTNTRRGR